MSIDEKVIERIRRGMFHGNPRVCPGCGERAKLRPSPLSPEVCAEDGLLPFMCSQCGRHVQPDDRRVYAVPGPRPK